MGRRLRRVPLDFNWPIDKVWQGYINPHYAARVDCLACGKRGYAPEAALFNQQWYGNAPFDPSAYGATPLTVDHPGVQAFAKRNVERAPGYYKHYGELVEHAIEREAHRLCDLWRGQWCHHLIQTDVDALVAAGRLAVFTHRPRTQEQADALKATDGYWMPEWNGYTPTADEINSWSIEGMGHDSLNHHVCVTARCAREGFPVMCPNCGGKGYTWPSPEAERRCDTWEAYDPPEGAGFQLWETISEGSPITPVFETIEELCVYAAAHCSVGSQKVPAEKWREMWASLPTSTTG
jgi:hypothetical protein